MYLLMFASWDLISRRVQRHNELILDEDGRDQSVHNDYLIRDCWGLWVGLQPRKWGLVSWADWSGD